jgi:hypothetical protein
VIRQISRAEVFSRSRLADYYISGMQSPSYDSSTDNSIEDVKLEYEYEILEGDDDTEDVDYTYSWEEEGSLLADLNDHTKPSHDGGRLTDDFAVLGYSRKNAGDYLANRSKALIRFFEIMHISQLYLMDEKRYDWLRFPFRSQEKLGVVKSWVNVPSYREAFEMDIEELEVILPLFHYSGRHSMPIIILISSNDTVPIAMFLCDDGNFHTSFYSEDREKIFYAASAVGLVMGGVDVCSQT